MEGENQANKKEQISELSNDTERIYIVDSEDVHENAGESNNRKLSDEAGYGAKLELDLNSSGSDDEFEPEFVLAKKGERKASTFLRKKSILIGTRPEGYHEHEPEHRPEKKNKFKQMTIRKERHKYTVSNLNVSSILKKNSLRKTSDSNLNCDRKEEDADSIFDEKFLKNLLEHNKTYKIDQNYIEKHPKINWQHRAECFSWLMEVCEEYAFKRETFHLTVYNVDRYMSRTKNIRDWSQFYFIATVILNLCAKIEEVQIPKIEEYLFSLNEKSDRNYYDFDMYETEQSVIIQLNWKALPMTINAWLSWHICQWDLFIDSMEGVKENYLKHMKEKHIVYFKKKEDKAYNNYRSITQLIDLFVLDHNYLKYNIQHLVCGAILMVLWINYEKNVNLCILKKYTSGYMKVYQDFITDSLGEGVFDSKEFLEAIDYCIAMTNGVKFDFEVPLIYQIREEELEKGSYEEFLTYQTFNGELIKKVGEVLKS